MKRLTLIILGVLLCTPLYSDMNTYVIGSGVPVSGGTYEIYDDFSTDTRANYSRLLDSDAYDLVWSDSDYKMHGTMWRGVRYYHETALSSVNHYVQGKIMYGADNNTNRSGLIARCDGLNTYYIIKPVNSNYIVLYRVIEGSATYLTQYNGGYSGGTEYTVKMSVSGTGESVGITVDVDGVQRISYSDTDAARITSGSYVGLEISRTSGESYDVTVDDFIGDAP